MLSLPKHPGSAAARTAARAQCVLVIPREHHLAQDVEVSGDGFTGVGISLGTTLGTAMLFGICGAPIGCARLSIGLAHFGSEQSRCCFASAAFT